MLYLVEVLLHQLAAAATMGSSSAQLENLIKAAQLRVQEDASSVAGNSSVEPESRAKEVAKDRAESWRNKVVNNLPKNWSEQSMPALNATDVTTQVTCAKLQTWIRAERHKELQDLACHLLAPSKNTKRARGCECRLLQKRATGGKCPYDCSSSGVPACVEGAARQLGLTGLTSGAPLGVPVRLGKANLEAFTCTYWSFAIDTTLDGMDERARVRGRMRYMDIIRRLRANADPVAEGKMEALKQEAPTFDFEQSLQGVSDGGPHAWATVGMNKTIKKQLEARPDIDAENAPNASLFDSLDSP